MHALIPMIIYLSYVSKRPWQVFLPVQSIDLIPASNDLAIPSCVYPCDARRMIHIHLTIILLWNKSPFVYKFIYKYIIDEMYLDG